jgi:hypothetical protein
LSPRAIISDNGKSYATYQVKQLCST